MKVGELIDKLNKIPLDVEVYVTINIPYTNGISEEVPVTHIYLDEDESRLYIRETYDYGF